MTSVFESTADFKPVVLCSALKYVLFFLCEFKTQIFKLGLDLRKCLNLQENINSVQFRKEIFIPTK
jgi:hypothetical protein